jgi:hypothetical protein
MGLIEDELTEHCLSSSSSLKKKEVLAYLGGGKNLRSGSSILLLWQFFVALEHVTYLYLGFTLVSTPFESHVSSYSFDSFKENLGCRHIPCRHTLLTPSKRSIGCCHIIILGHSCFVESMLPSHSLCHHMFKGSQPLHFHPCVSSPSFDPSLFITILICFVSMMGDTSWPSFDKSISIESTHYPRIRLRNQLVPWSLHASMAGFLIFDSWFTSLTSD